MAVNRVFPKRQEDPLIQQLLEKARREAAQSSAIGSPGMYKAAAGGGIGPVAGVLTAQVLGGIRSRNALQAAQLKEEQTNIASSKLAQVLANRQVDGKIMGDDGRFYETTSSESIPIEEVNLADALKQTKSLGEGFLTQPMQPPNETSDYTQEQVKVPITSIDQIPEEERFLYTGTRDKYDPTTVDIPGTPKADNFLAKAANFITGKQDIKTIKAADLFELSAAARIPPEQMFAYLQTQKTGGKTTYTKPELSYISQPNEDNTINNINALTRVATINNPDGTTEQKIEIRENGIFRPLKPNEKFIPKISEKDNTPRYFKNNGGDFNYTDTDGIEKTLKNGEQFRVELGSPKELLKLSKTQNAEEIKLIGDKGFAPRPLIIPDNPGEVAARIISSHGTNGYNESIMVSKDLEIDTPNGTIMFKADQTIKTNDPNYNLLKNKLQESSYSNISNFATSGLLSSTKLNDLRAEVLTARTGFFNLANYVNTIDRTNLGLQRDIDKVTSWFKTVFMPEKQLDDQQVALRIANGQLSRLGGTLRLDILGPGVMTEQDFLRLREALGNDPNSAQSIQAFKETLHLILKEKEMTYKDKNSYYEKQRTAVPQREKGFPSVDLEIPEYKSFFEVTTEPTFITGTIMNMQPNDDMFKSINKTMNTIQQRIGKVTEEEMLKFYNKRQLNAIKKRFDQLGIK